MNNVIKKYFPVFILVLFSINLFANRLPVKANDAVKLGHITKLLWQPAKLTEKDEESLWKIVKYPHGDVASYALVTAIVRKAENLPEILEYASKLKNGNVPQIAKHVQGLLKNNGNVLAQLRKELQNKKLLLRTIPTSGEYYRDILVYNAVRKARKKQETVIIPAKIIFNWKQKALLMYAGKPMDQAVDYIFSIIEKQKKTSETLYALVAALSAYEKVFINKAANKLMDKKSSNLVKLAMKAYLNRNRYRLTPKEYILAKEAFPEIARISLK